MDVYSLVLCPAYQLYRFAGTDMLYHHLRPCPFCQLQIPLYQPDLCLPWGTADPIILRRRSGMDAIVYNKPRILFMEADRLLQLSCPHHGLLYQLRI